MAFHPAEAREIRAGEREETVPHRQRELVDDGEPGDRAEGLLRLHHPADDAVRDRQDRKVHRPTRHGPHHPGKIGGRHQTSLGIQGARGEFAVGAWSALVGNAGHAVLLSLGHKRSGPLGCRGGRRITRAARPASAHAGAQPPR